MNHRNAIGEFPVSPSLAWSSEHQRLTPPKCDDSIGVLVSGGVDSSVALARLKAAGYSNINAYYLKIWLEDELSSIGQCPWEEDLEYARAVCAMFDVPLTVVSLQTDYYERVVEYTLAELRRGRTPSPDIFCNQRIKFGAFFERVGPEVDWVASGHYGRVVEADSGRFHLYRAPDEVKDQSYFLSHLSQSQLARILFPIGDLRKDAVRALAEQLKLPNRRRPDSQGICFLGKISYPDFVRHYLGEREGDIVDRDTGRRLGAHRGYWFYTIGQRQGLGLSGGPWYVTGKDVEANVVFVSHGDRVGNRAVNAVQITDIHCIGTPPALEDAAFPDAPFDGSDGERTGLSVKLRHGPKRIACRVEPAEEAGQAMERHGDAAPMQRRGDAAPYTQTALRRVCGETADDACGKNINLYLEESDRGAAPGQFAVLYWGRRCIAAGRIAGGTRVADAPREARGNEVNA